jgi:hypothetical protein
MIGRHKTEKRVQFLVHNNKVNVILFGYGFPKRQRRAAQRVRAEAQAGFGNGLHVDDVFQIINIGHNKIDMPHAISLVCLLERHAFDAAVFRGQVFIGTLFNPGRDLGSCRASVIFVVFEAPIFRRIV